MRGDDAAGGVAGCDAPSPAQAVPDAIVVVCIGNICRSPIGEALLSARLRSLGYGTRVSSAGVAACVGMPADPMSIILMEERGLDIGGHRGRQLHPHAVDDHTLLLVMAEEQRRWILKQRRALAPRVALLGHWEGADIRDPVGGSREDFEVATHAIERGIDSWLTHGWRLPASRDGS